MSDINIKQCALDALKNYYVDFYRKNVATAPKKVQEIEYFLNWLSEKATIDNISYTANEYYQKKFYLNLSIEYYFSFGSGSNSVQSKNYYMTKDTYAIIVDKENLATDYSDVFYSKEASTDIAPKKIRDFANERARALLRDYDSDARLYKAKILSCEMTKPEKLYYYSCTINYPFPDKTGTINNNFSFTVWDNEVIYTWGPKKKKTSWFS